MTTGRALARASLLVTGAFLVSRVLGWVRLVVISTTFGIGAALDPFFAAFRIPDLIFQLVAAGALASALIPTIATLLAADEESRAWRVVSTVTNIMLVALALLAGVLWIFAPAIVPVITPGFDAAQWAQTVDLTRLMLLSPILLALGSVAGSVLQARGRFFASVVAPIAYNLAIIGAALFLAPSMGVAGIAVGVVAGSALHLLVQVWPLFGSVGFRYAPRIDAGDPEARRTILLLVPRAVGLGGAQLQLLAATTIASALGAGAISAFNIAFTVFQIPIGVLGAPLGLVALPALSHRVATGAVDDYVALVVRAVRLMSFAMVPLAFFGVVAARPLVTLLFGYGKVTAGELSATSAVLAVFFVALASESAIVILARAFYAARDTRTPVAAALVAVVISIAVSVVVAPTMGAPGLAAGIAIGSWGETVVLLILLDRRVPALHLGAIVRGVALFVGCAVAGTLALGGVFVVAEGIVGASPGKIVLAIELAVGGLAGGLAYLGVAWLLHIPEVPDIIRLVTSALRRGPAS